MSLSDPDVRDINAAELRPAGELETANHLLDDHPALMRWYEENGYLFFRQVLDIESVATARREMMAAIAPYGAVEDPDADEAIWTGVPLPEGLEESPIFAGIVGRLLRRPANMAVIAKILGEEPSLVPIVQYRAYAPGKAAGGVHQDGFFSPGIEGYKPLWMPIAEIDELAGGLLLAAGQNRRGYLHNLAKPPPCPVADVIPPSAWRSAHYYPGDLLVIHPNTPHTGMANRSNKLRVSIDARVQSAADPRILLGVLRAVEPGRIELETEQGRRFSLAVDEESFIRIGEIPSIRLPLEQLVPAARLGMSLLVSFNGGRAVTLRRAAEG